MANSSVFWLTIVAETLTLLSTFPTLCRMPVAISDMPAARAVSASSAREFDSLSIMLSNSLERMPISSSRSRLILAVKSSWLPISTACSVSEDSGAMTVRCSSARSTSSRIRPDAMVESIA